MANVLVIIGLKNYADQLDPGKAKKLESTSWPCPKDPTERKQNFVYLKRAYLICFFSYTAQIVVT